MCWNFEANNEKNTLGIWIAVIMALVRKAMQLNQKKLINKAIKTKFCCANEYKLTHVYSGMNLSQKNFDFLKSLTQLSKEKEQTLVF